jgi:acetyl-CoA acetyltransferase
VRDVQLSFRAKTVITGYGETPVTRAKKERGEPALSFWDYLSWAADLALEDASLELKDFNGQGLAVVHPEVDHSINFGCEVAEHLGITPSWLITTSHGGASGLTALAQAAAALACGLVDRVLCLGADAPMGYPQMRITQHNADYERPFGVMGPNSSFAMIMRRHMEQYGTKAEQTGLIAVAQRENALHNENAIFKQPITLQDYLNSKMIADPIRLLDAVMPVNGGLGFVVTRNEQHRSGDKSPIYLLGYGECDNYFQGNKATPDITYTGVDMSSKIALKMAAMKISDMNFFQPYDDYAIAVLMQIEDAGFCRKGEGGKFVENTDLTHKGVLPVNTGGGQLSAGQPGLAGGLVNLVEGIRQLRGEGGRRQVKEARYGMITGIGNLQYARDLAYTAVAVLGNQS